MRELSDDEIIAVRKATPSNYSRPWGDTLAFARAILAAAQAAMPPREPTQEMDAAVGNDADARDAVAPSPPVPPSPDGVQSSICPLCDGRFVDLALSRANVVIVRLTRERDEALAECERLRALVEAADHLYAAAEHIGGTPGCWKCEAADEYRHARAAIDAGRKA